MMKSVLQISGVGGVCVFVIFLLSVGCAPPPVGETPPDAEVHSVDGAPRDTQEKTTPDREASPEPQTRPEPTSPPDEPTASDTMATPEERGGLDSSLADQQTSEHRPDAPLSETTPETGSDTTPDGPMACPPGCTRGSCGPMPGTKVGEGKACTVPASGQPNPCQSGFTCLESRVFDGQSSRPLAYCAKTCASKTNCSSSQECVTVGASRVCANPKGPSETCDVRNFELCAAPGGVALDCLVKAAKTEFAGICAQRCQSQSNCTQGQICRKWSPSASLSYCLDPLLPGPQCLGETCDGRLSATNCNKGLHCESGLCVKTCTKATEQTDCNTTSGEVCLVASGAPKGYCQPKATVIKVGDECSLLKRCDPTKKLACITDGNTSRCFNSCDANTEVNNPDCATGELCQKPDTNSPIGICRIKANIGAPCGTQYTCSQTPSTCTKIDDALGPYCLRLCDTAKNKSATDATNPTCDSGKGQCRQLATPITSGGQSYSGVCMFARPTTAKPGEGCGYTKALGPRSPTCVSGGRCIALGTAAPLCFTDCDPCNMTRVGGAWLHPLCTNGTMTCISLTNDGLPAGGICLPPSKPIRNEGEVCDAQQGCKSGLLCIRFSNASNTSSICAKACDPSKGTSTNPDCNGGRCGGLSAGGGVCVPTPSPTRNIGETCNGPIGSPEFGDCLPTSGGNTLICATPDAVGSTGICQVECSIANGLKNNSDCTTAGLSDHLCLPADLRQPGKGGCTETCSFGSGTQCKKLCTHGQCKDVFLGKVGDCTTAANEATCKSNGGLCTKQTCVVTACF